MGVVAVERAAFAIALFGHDDPLALEGSEILEHTVAAAEARRGWHVPGLRVLHMVPEQAQDAAGGQRLLHRLLIEEFAAQPGSVREHGVTPLVDELVVLELRRLDQALDAEPRA